MLKILRFYNAVLNITYQYILVFIFRVIIEVIQILDIVGTFIVLSKFFDYRKVKKKSQVSNTSNRATRKVKSKKLPYCCIIFILAWICSVESFSEVASIVTGFMGTGKKRTSPLGYYRT